MSLLNEGIRDKLVIKTNVIKKMNVGGNTENYPVYKVRLDCLFYNNLNGRIATWISKFNSENEEFIDLKNYDLKKYNDIIHKFIVESGKHEIKNTQDNIKRFDQIVPGIVLDDGRVIDGNRRFTCLRNLSKVEGNDKFNYFETIILDRNYTIHAKDIKKLELQVQHGVDEKVKYNPIDNLVEIYETIEDKKLLTPEEYSDSVYGTKSKVKKVNEDLVVARLLVEYLSFIKEDRKFFIARDEKLDGPLREIPKILKKCSSQEERDDMKDICFMLIKQKVNSDMTRYLRNNITKIIKNPREKRKFIEESSSKVDDFLGKIILPKKNRQDIIQQPNCVDESLDTMISSDRDFHFRNELNEIVDEGFDYDSKTTNEEKSIDKEKEKLNKELDSIISKRVSSVNMINDREDAKNQVVRCTNIISNINFDVVGILSENEKKSLRTAINELICEINKVQELI